jgi:ribose transport system ATP-binding protein
VPDLSVAENIFLGQLGKSGFWMKWGKMKKEASVLINNLGFDIDPAVKVGRLSIAHQQIVEIAKALSEKVRVLVLDEPSAVLGPFEIQKLFETLNKLKKEDVSIIYISHHLDEIFQIADRVTVLKDGVSSDSLKISDTNKEAVIRKMLGRSLDTLYPKRQSIIGDEIINVKDVRIGDILGKISFSVGAGEVLGIAGLVGSGRTEMIRAIFAADKKGGGEILLQGIPKRINAPYEAIKAGIGMVPEDRKQHGVILRLSIKDNISLTNLDRITNSMGFINAETEGKMAEAMMTKLSIKAKDEKIEVGKLSGGNQQKVALAKWISRDCKVIIIDEPTRGVDVGAKVEIYHLINDLSARGNAVVIISSETSELMGICDRILVMRKGEITGELKKTDFSEERILRLSIGA